VPAVPSSFDRREQVYAGPALSSMKVIPEDSIREAGWRPAGSRCRC